MAMNPANMRSAFIPEAIEEINLHHNKSGVDPIYKKIFKVTGTKTQYARARYSGIGAGPLQRTEQFQEFPELNIQSGYEKEFHQVKYAAKITFPDELVRFNRRDLYKSLVEALKDAGPYLCELMTTAILEYGELAMASVPESSPGVPMVDTIAADGQPIFGTHTFKGSANTITNLHAGYIDPTQANLAALITDVMRWKTGNNRPLNAKLGSFIIPTGLWAKFSKQLAMGNNPETANNDINVLNGMVRPGDYLINPLLNDQSDYYYRTNEMNDFRVRVALESEVKNGEDTKADVFWMTDKKYANFGVGYPLHIGKVAA